jgi:TRAP-type mannitol/chloroaromatic compound transport system substrate-binding protein
MSDMADRVRVASAGRLDITVHPGGAIVENYEEIPAIKDGVAELCYGHLGVHRKFIGDVGYLLAPSGLPGGPDPIEIIGWYYVGGGKEIVDEIMEPWGITISCTAQPAELFAHSNKKLVSAEDFNGVKFRTIGLWGDILTEYGASVVTLSGSEIYPAAEKGVIDAFEFGVPDKNWKQGFHEITKYVEVPGIHSPSSPFYLVANHDAWGELPADLKQILVAEAKAMNIDGYMSGWMLDAIAMENYENYEGTEIVTLSQEFQEKVAQDGLRKLEEIATEDPLFKEVWEQQKAYFAAIRGVTAVVQPKINVFDYVK